MKIYLSNSANIQLLELSVIDLGKIRPSQAELKR